ncbi:uncharacterized protein F5891DRAFT_985705 [Suillus fuscotomentosus]|uniref:Uncharacterized protein n=1 Tax=Suillus fuscotomentosus TaxID=1912939 RepID=A0AAD4DTH2_9AGAM|nr:uncharacterized protein F5891DRAFT_985705 [Suillus fuscotomentosus]KAG1893648.1 hypothetical protein F5891DRAFT_985705 [Suillus fuscotomentosus]
MPASAWNGPNFIATVHVTQPTPVAISSMTGIFVLVFLVKCEAAKGKKWRGLGVSFRIVPIAGALSYVDTHEKATGYIEDHSINGIQRCRFVLGPNADILPQGCTERTDDSATHIAEDSDSGSRCSAYTALVTHCNPRGCIRDASTGLASLHRVLLYNRFIVAQPRLNVSGHGGYEEITNYTSMTHSLTVISVDGLCPSNLPRFQTFNPDMENLYDGAQPPVGQRRSYTKHSSYVALSGGFMGYIPLPSSEGDQEHPSASAGPDSQSHTLPIQSSITLPSPGSDLVTVPTPISTSPTSAPPSSPPPSDHPILPSSDNYESAPEPQSSVVDSQATFELLQALASVVPGVGSVEFPDELHSQELEDSQYNQLEEEIIQWPVL